MSKNAFIIFILCVLLVMGVLGWYVFFRAESAPVPGIETGDDPSDLFPFGQVPSGSTAPGGLVTSPIDGGDGTIDLGTGAGEDILPPLRQISMVPTAGAIAFDVATTTYVRYIERATGHIYETANAALAVKKLSNTTIPKVHEALWSSDGTKLLIRYIKDDTTKIRTFYAKIATTTRPEQAIEGIFLADDIRDVSVAGNKMFYMTESSSGSTGIISDFDGSNRASAFTSSFNDWRSSLASPSIAMLFSRPSGNVPGSAYVLNASTGIYTKAANDLPGLVALANADASRVLASANINRSLTTLVYDKAGISETLGVRTIADKCVWGTKNRNIVYCAVPQSLPSALYPDDWYKGKVSFDDTLWKIDLESGETEEVFSPELEAGVSMDIFKPSLNQSETVLVFTNKKDMTVWSYRLD